MALRELGLPSRPSGLKPQGLNSIPDCLHQDGMCTWSSLLSQHSLKNGTSHKLSPCYSDHNVSVFTLGCAFWSSGSGAVNSSLSGYIFLLLLCFKEICVINANRVDPDQRLHSRSVLFASYPLGMSPPK